MVSKVSEPTLATRNLFFDTATLYYRAFFAVPESITAPDGTPSGAVRGFLDMVSAIAKQYFYKNVKSENIAVLGLNPHASDNGLIGKEDLEIVSPAIEKAKSENIFCFGPYPADGFFGNAQYHNFDAILAMYHDQGLIPFKTLAFGEGTNYTAGLSFVRTSPDHGTGYDIAGKGIADSSSMLRAIFWAVDICRSRNIEKGLEDNKLDPNLVKNFYKTQKVRE